MRALIDLHHLGRHQTGNETWARSIASHLLRFPGEDEYDVVVTDAAGETSKQFPARTTEIVSGSSTRRLLWDMPRLLRTLDSDVALVQYSMPITSVPCVVAVHDLSFEAPRAREWLPLPTRLRYRATIRASVRRAAHVLALSAHTRSDLIQYYDVEPNRITVVSAAANPALLRRIEGASAAKVPGNVVTVGNVLPRKNLLVLARAVRNLRQAGQDVRLSVVGTVPHQGRGIHTEITHLLGSAVTFTGYVSDEGLASAYRSADVFAFPSLYEGFGIPVLEAMSAGVPVVCSDASSLPEVVGDAALVTSATNVDAWVANLGTALGDIQVRSRLISAGRNRVTDFSWEHSAALVRRALRATVSPDR